MSKRLNEAPAYTSSAALSAVGRLPNQIWHLLIVTLCSLSIVIVGSFSSVSWTPAQNSGKRQNLKHGNLHLLPLIWSGQFHQRMGRRTEGFACPRLAWKAHPRKKMRCCVTYERLLGHHSAERAQKWSPTCAYTYCSLESGQQWLTDEKLSSAERFTGTGDFDCRSLSFSLLDPLRTTVRHFRSNLLHHIRGGALHEI